MPLKKSVQVTVAESESRRWSRGAGLAAVALSALLASAGVLLGVRLLAGGGTAPAPGTRPAALDAQSLTPFPSPPADAAAVPGSTRLALVGPLVLLDSRGTGGLAPGAEVALPLPVLPAGSTAVLLEVSLTAAAGSGAVTVGSEAGERTVLQVPGPGIMATATTVVPVGPDGQLRARTEGGGHLLVNLVGAFEPAEAATAGRIVPVPATEVLRLVPDTDGHDATIDLAGVPGGLKAGASGVMLQISADVGVNGGFVAVGGSADNLNQQFFWTATAGEDRTRDEFLVVPVSGDSVYLHYEAGDVLTADLVGYVTDGSAVEEAAGLVVPVPPSAPTPVQVPAGEPVEVPVVPADGLAGVPAERAAAALLGVTATGEAIGGIAVYGPEDAEPRNPALTAAAGRPRATVALARLVDGRVQVGSEAGASVTLEPQAIVLSQAP